MPGLQRYLRTHDIIFQQPPEIWQEGLLMGNGDMVCVSFADPGAFAWTIGTTDCHDSRFEEDPARDGYYRSVLELLKAGDRAGMIRLFQESRRPVHNTTYPDAKSCGLLTLGIEGLDTLNVKRGQYEQRLRIADGINQISLSVPGLLLRCESLVWRAYNVLCIRLRGSSARMREVIVSFQRWLDPMINPPRFHERQPPGRFSMVHDMNGRDGYAVAGAVLGIVGANRTTETSFTYRGQAGPGAFNMEVFLSLHGQVGKPPSRKAARKALEHSIETGFRTIRGENLRAWRKFWEKGCLWSRDAFLEQAYYVSLYHLACSAGRSALPLTITLPGNLNDYDEGYFVCDSNIEMSHWPMLPSNHPELMRPFHDFFSRHLERIRGETKRYFGLKGASIPFSLGVDGTPLGDTWARLMLQPTGWIAELLWWCYEFTQDRALLRDSLYPFIREAAAFYIAYLTPDAEGRLSGYPSVPPEQRDADGGPLWVRNDSAGRSSIHVALKAAAESCRILGMDTDFELECRRTLERLADYPNNGTVLLDFEGAPADLPLHHCALLNGVFSTGEINRWGDKGLYSMAKRTFAGIFDRAHSTRRGGHNPWGIPLWVDDVMYCWLICVAARLGEAERAWACLHDQVFLLQMRENGTPSLHEPVFPQRRRSTHWPNSNHIAGIAAAILEMFLQSHAGAIEVFRGVPPAWDGGFNGLLARGAFEVSARRARGEVLEIGVRSLAGMPCRIVNPWKSDAVAIFRGVQKVGEIAQGAEFIEFSTKPGESFLALPAWAVRGRRGARRFPATRSVLRIPRSYTGPKYLGRTMNAAAPEKVTIGRRYQERTVSRMPRDGSLTIPGCSYSTGNSWYFGGTHLSVDPIGLPEYGLQPTIRDFSFGGPYPEYAEYWIDCAKDVVADISIGYTTSAVMRVGPGCRLLLNGKLVSDSLFGYGGGAGSGVVAEEDEARVGPVLLSKGRNILRIERRGHLPPLREIRICSQ